MQPRALSYSKIEKHSADPLLQSSPLCRNMLKGLFYAFCSACALQSLAACLSILRIKDSITAHIVLKNTALQSRIPTNQSNKPAGTFNGYDIFHVNHPPKSTVHCIGENFQVNRSWLFRSCEYTTMCFDTVKKDFVIYRDNPVDMPFLWYSSTQVRSNDTAVAGGSQPKSWFPVLADMHGIVTRIGKYYPRLETERPKSYYRYNATLLPFYRHPTSHRNPGHLIWDDFMSLYTLLDVFDRTQDTLHMAQMRRPTTLEFEEPIPDFDILNKFLIFMGLPHDYNIDVQTGFDTVEWDAAHTPPNSTSDEPMVICADHALTGNGVMSDHGENHWHGQGEADRVYPHNHGRGGLFRRYRRWILSHLNLPEPVMARHPYRIIVAQNSSTKGYRSNVMFEEYMDAMRNESSIRDRVTLHPVQLAKIKSVKDQVELIMNATIYISTVGGGTSTAMFLPKGAHLILFYPPMKVLDWDFWNNFAHLHIHWIPMWKEGEENVWQELDTFVKLISTELDALDAAAVN